MAEWIPPSLPSSRGLPQRPQRPARGAGDPGSSESLWPWATPCYSWRLCSPKPSLVTPLDRSCRVSWPPLAGLAEPPPGPRLASSPIPRRPLALGRCPLPALSSRCRKASPEGAPGQPLVLHAGGPELRSAGAFGDHTGDNTWDYGAVGILKKQKSCSNKMGRRNGENSGTNLQVSNISHESLFHWNLELEEPVLENINSLPGRENTAGGKINKNHLEIPVEQLMVELNLSDHTHKRIQNNKAGTFQLWSYRLNDGSPTENRDFKKPSLETGYSIPNNPMRLFTVSDSLPKASVDKQIGSYHGLQVPFNLCWPYADGDFFKGRVEPHITLYSTIENNDGETAFSPSWNMKCGCSSVEENLTDESDLSENEKASDNLLNYFKNMDLTLKPEAIETVEDSFREESSEGFPYPDFLPHPFNTLDLHKLALSKSENWKATESPEISLDRLITRLLEMERLQHMTVQKERPRLQSTFCTPIVTERPSSSKAVPKMRQPKLSDSLSLQTTCTDKSREKRKANSGSCKFEQTTSKWNWNNAGKCKWTCRPPSLKSSSSTKQLVATGDELKGSKSSVLVPCQELTIKPTYAQTSQSLLKMVSTRCLPPRSPIAVSPIPLSFPENPREEIKTTRTKKKLYQKTVLNRPFCIQKLNCLTPSFTVKGKCSPTDQK